MYERWMKGDFEAALTYLEQHPEAGERAPGLAEYAKQLSADKLPELARRVAALNNEEMRDKALQSVMLVWTESDPAAVCRFCFPMKEVPPSMSLHLSQWIDLDAQAAVTALQLLPTGERRNQLMQSAVQTLLDRQQVDLVLQVLAGAKASDLDRIFINLTEFSRFSQDFDLSPEQFQKLYEGLPETPGKKMLQTAAAYAWANQMQFEPAIALVAKMETGRDRESVLKHIGEQWHQWSPTDANAWVASFPPGREREAVLSGIGNAIAQRRPEEAIPVLEQIQDKEERKQLIQRIANGWRLVDKSSLKSWLESLPEVSRVQRAELLEE